MSKFLICFETFVMYYVEIELKISKMFPQKSLIEKGLGFVVFSTVAFVKPSTSQKIFSECRVDLFWYAGILKSILTKLENITQDLRNSESLLIILLILLLCFHYHILMTDWQGVIVINSSSKEKTSSLCAMLSATLCR